MRYRFDYQSDPGHTFSDSSTISNLGTEPLTMDVYATDAVNSDNGKFALPPAADTPTDLGAWIAPELSEVTVPPGGTADVPFALTIPDDALPGDHAAGIVASRLVDATEGSGARIKLDERVGARVYLRVFGAIEPALTLTDVRLDHSATWFPFSRQPTRLSYRVENPGNVALSVYVDIEITDAFGDVTTSTWELDGLLPRNGISHVVDLPDVASVGKAVARIHAQGTLPGDLAGVASPTAGAVAEAFALPLLLLVLVVLATTAVVVWVVRRRRRRAAALPPAPLADPEQPAPGERMQRVVDRSQG